MSNTMMAANLHGIGDLRYEEVPVPECKEDEVMLDVKYCGICGSDVGRVLKRGTYHFPTIPGHEFSGVISYDPKGEWTGRHATVFPLIPCRSCDMCEKGLYELCRHYDYYGSRRDGGYAQKLAVKRWNVVLLDDSVPLEQAALSEPMAVSHHAISRLHIQKGETILISGAGPIGLLAAQWAVIAGASKVYLFDIDKKKIEYAKTLGYFEYTDDVQTDVVLEGTGNGEALARCLRGVKPFGRVVLMGNPGGAVNLAQADYWQVLRKELTVYGTWNSAYREASNDWAAVVDALESRTIHPDLVISQIMPLSEVNKAFSMLTDRNVFTNRIVLKID